MPEKPAAQIIAACENQRREHKLRDHWISIKRLFLKKITGDHTKKTKTLTEIQVLTKEFTKSLQKNESNTVT